MHPMRKKLKQQFPRLPLIKDGVAQMEPFKGFKDYDYLFELTKKYRYNKTPREKVEMDLIKYLRAIWKGFDQKTHTPLGVVFITYLPWMGYSFDAYFDHELAYTIDPKANYSMRAGHMTLAYFFTFMHNHIFTTHDIRNRAATIASKKLGFQVINEYDTSHGKFVLMLNKGEKYGR